MEANTGSPTSPRWLTLYEAAILELNSSTFLQRIAEAEHAVMDRMEDLNRSEDGAERMALINALNTLRDLRKVADRDGQSQE